MPNPELSPPERAFTIKDTIEYLKDSGGDYIKAKAELASIEVKEATDEGIKRASLGAILAFFGLFSYVLLLATLVGVGSKLLEGNLTSLEQHIGTWPIVTLGLLIIHLLFVFIFLDKLKTAGKKTLFTHTKAELEKDKLWLQQLKSKSGN